MKLKKMLSLCIVFVMFSCLISFKPADSNPLSILKLAYNLDRGREDDSVYSMMYKNELNIAKSTNSMSINMSLTIGANAISTEKQQKASGKIQVIIGSSFIIEDIILMSSWTQYKLGVGDLNYTMKVSTSDEKLKDVKEVEPPVGMDIENAVDTGGLPGVGEVI